MSRLTRRIHPANKLRLGLSPGWRVCLAIVWCLSSSGNCLAQSKQRTGDNELKIPSGIAWYGVLTDGIAEAKATNRPIMLLSAAPQCAGVPGMW